MLKVIRFLLVIPILFQLSLKGQDNFPSPSQRTFDELEKPIFRKNKGQWDPSIHYKLSSGHTSISFFKNKIQFGMRKVIDREIKSIEHPDNVSFLVWEIELQNSKKDVSFIGGGKRNSKVSFFKGNSGKAIGLEEYEKITYKNIYPNIDLVFYLDSKQNLKYDFVLGVGANYNDIQLKYNGIEKLKKDRQGNLVIITPWGNKLKEGNWKTYDSLKNCIVSDRRSSLLPTSRRKIIIQRNNCNKDDNT